MKRAAMIFLVALSALPSASAQGTSPVITLSQSIDAALANGDENKILQRNLDVGRAQHALNVSRNSLSLTGAAGYGANWGFGDSTLIDSRAVSSPSPGGTGPTAGLALSGPLTTVSLAAAPWIPPASGGDTTSSVGVSVSQTLWNGYPGGVGQATVDKSVLTLQGRELATESGRIGLIYNVKQAYYAMLSAQRNLSLKNQIFDKQKAVRAQIAAIYDLKLASTADLKTAELNARIAQVDVDGAEHDLRIARITLATFMGSSLESDFSVADAADPTVPASTVEEAVAAGLSRRMDIKQLELNVKSSNIDLAVARGQATPTLSVSGGVNWLYDWTGKVGAGVASAGVKVSMPVLDAGAVKNQVDSILRQNDVYAAQASQLQKSIATSIRNAWEGVQLANEKLDVAMLSVEAADLQYQIVSAQRDSGTASNQDLLSSALNLANARNAGAAAQSAAQLAVLQLQNAMGL
jgi:outer membrane protein